eukprot:scaffold2775_cov343-Prasinococcus_capsulatus_cf.AAC.6
MELTCSEAHHDAARRAELVHVGGVLRAAKLEATPRVGVSLAVLATAAAVHRVHERLALRHARPGVPFVGWQTCNASAVHPSASSHEPRATTD